MILRSREILEELKVTKELELKLIQEELESFESRKYIDWNNSTAEKLEFTKGQTIKDIEIVRDPNRKDWIQGDIRKLMIFMSDGTEFEVYADDDDLHVNIM